MMPHLLPAGRGVPPDGASPPCPPRARPPAPPYRRRCRRRVTRRVFHRLFALTRRHVLLLPLRAPRCVRLGARRPFVCRRRRCGGRPWGLWSLAAARWPCASPSSRPLPSVGAVRGIKSKSSAKRRFKVLGSGKIKRWKGGKRHINAKRNRKHIRRLGGPSTPRVFRSSTPRRCWAASSEYQQSELRYMIYVGVFFGTSCYF